MKLTRVLKENSFLIFLKLLPTMVLEYSNLAKHLARSNMSKSKFKFQTEITMTYHAIEKGLALPKPRTGFGEDRVLKLQKDILYYINKFRVEDDFLLSSLSTIKAYINFQEKKGYQSDKFNTIKKNFISINRTLNLDEINLTSGGTKLCVRGEVLKKSLIDFEGFAFSRFSIRKFSNEEVDKDLIIKALNIATKTPSACNRQSYRVHIFEKHQKDELLRIQGGSNGFIESVNKVAMITGDFNKYFLSEVHMPYVDGGLFAMSFMYALHSIGLGSIPLTMARSYSILLNVIKEFNIPSNEIPVMLVGIGHLPEEFEVAYSYRNKVDTFTTFHISAK